VPGAASIGARAPASHPIAFSTKSGNPSWNAKSESARSNPRMITFAGRTAVTMRAVGPAAAIARAPASSAPDASRRSSARSTRMSVAGTNARTGCACHPVIDGAATSPAMSTIDASQPTGCG